MNNLVISIIALVLLLNVARGGPAQRSRREVYPEIEPEKVEDVEPQVCVVGDLVYGAEEPVPADQPCLKCKCQPPGVHCEATRCLKKPGCRAIHKPNTCCPDYQCECEHEGITYGNGERLEQKPGAECRVCYCRGGEVQCADVSCYIRNDCEGRQVPGKCCPKYDHCPPKEPTVDRPYSPELNNITKETSTDNEIVELSEHLKLDKSTQTRDEIQKITIHEIIPDIKEIPITNSPKREIDESLHGQLVVEESVKEVVNTHINEHVNKVSTEGNELDIPDADSESSEVSEIYQQPVLRIGDKLLFLKKGELVPEKDASTPATIITIIGAEGLQRGFEDSVENHEKQEAENKTQFYGETDPTQDIQSVAESTHILSLVQKPTTTENVLDATTVFMKSSSEGVVTEINTTTPEQELIDDSLFTNSSIEIELPSMNNTDSLDIHETELINTTEYTIETTPQVILNTSPAVQKSTTEKEEIQEGNPEYPPIPEIMTRPDEQAEHSEADKNAQIDIKTRSYDNSGISSFDDAKILPHVLPSRSNKTVPQNMSNPEWLKTTLINPKAQLPDSILSETAESDKFTTTEPDMSIEELSTTSKSQLKTSEIVKFGTPIDNTDFTLNHIKALSQEEFSSETVTTLYDRSVESLEEVTEDSDEAVTPANIEVSPTTNEDASVENTQESTELNMSDLVEYLPGVNPTNTTTTQEQITESVTLRRDDVEMIDADLLKVHTNDAERNMTHEEKTKIIEKRQNDEDDSIFEELNHEIKLVSGEIHDNKTKEEEADEAEKIFKELLEEDSNTTPKPTNPQPRDRESAVLQRVSDAIAKFHLRDSKQSLDTNVLGILRDFFSSQYRAYNKK